jgi:predicted RNase H-like nuclease (RuvC/YqgF family)
MPHDLTKIEQLEGELAALGLENHRLQAALIAAMREASELKAILQQLDEAMDRDAGEAEKEAR